MKILCLLFILASAFTKAASYSDETLRVDNRERRYLVHDFSGMEPTALVILLHGGGGSGDNMAEQTGFDAVAEREGLIAVYPYGSSRLFDNRLLTWNAGHCCSYAMQAETDDVQFISALIDHLIATRRVDPRRVYVTGLSNGGMMSHRLGYELPHKIAAIAPVISSVFGDEPLRNFPMPVLTINGADDERVKVEGGALGGVLQTGIDNDNVADGPTLAIAKQGEYWAQVNACTGSSDLVTADYSRRVYSGCQAGGAVESYVVNGNGHAWPGGAAPRSGADMPVQTVNANELIWAFFQQFLLGTPGTGTNTAYYYDGVLVIPALTSSGNHYRAELELLPGSPLEFELAQLQQIPTTDAHHNFYQQDVLTLSPVVVGASQYQATMRLSNLNPVRLQLETLE